MKNEHWLGLASDGCKLLSRFHSRFHLRFQFEVRESAQVTCRDLRGPRSNLHLFFATIREIYVENTKKNWDLSRPRIIYPHRTAESGLSHSTTGFLLEAVSPNFCPLSQMGTTTSGGTRLRLCKSEFIRIKSFISCLWETSQKQNLYSCWRWAQQHLATQVDPNWKEL